MPISIRDCETDRLARERARRDRGRVRRLLAIGDRCARHTGKPFTSADIGSALPD